MLLPALCLGLKTSAIPALCKVLSIKVNESHTKYISNFFLSFFQMIAQKNSGEYFIIIGLKEFAKHFKYHCV